MLGHRLTVAPMKFSARPFTFRRLIVRYHRYLATRYRKELFEFDANICVFRRQMTIKPADSSRFALPASRAPLSKQGRFELHATTVFDAQKKSWHRSSDCGGDGTRLYAYPLNS
jgi:hypothetical protein